MAHARDKADLRKHRADDSYRRAAIANACERVRTATSGRNNVLNTEAHGLAKIPGVELAEVEPLLMAACDANGLTENGRAAAVSACRATIKSGWRGGLRERPAEIPGRHGPARSPSGGVAPMVEARPPARPPRAEVVSFWGDCVRAADDSDVSAWLLRRRMDADDVSRRDLCRALELGAACPPWAAMGRPWSDSSYRAIFPLFGATGEIESVRARWIDPCDPPGPKAAAPKGPEVRGLVLADWRGAALLRGERWAVEAALANGVVIAEGEPQFMKWGTFWPMGDRSAWAILGVFAGSWGADSWDLASRIPTGTTVAIRTDRDPAGAKYGDAIEATLKHRCVIARHQGVEDASRR